MAEGDTLVNALVGAVVGAILGVVLPFGPFFGGLAAGYLQGGDRSAGLRVGALSGLVAFVPILLVAGVVLFLFLPFLVGIPASEAVAVGAAGLAIVVTVLAAVFAYVVGLSALGGYAGNYLKYDTGIGD